MTSTAHQPPPTDKALPPDIRLPEKGVWRCHVLPGGTVRLAGSATQADGERLVTALAAGPDEDGITQTLTAIPGQFALVAEVPGRTLCAVDRIRSIPLIRATDAEGRTIVAQCADDLLSALPAGTGRIDPRQALAVAMSGFTVGAGTLYEGVSALLPGEYLLADGSGVTVKSYKSYRPWIEPRGEPTGDAGEALEAVLLTTLRSTIDKAAGRPIAVPLSAGLDSRFIASGLKHLGHDNIVTFSYGLPGNREAEAAKQIAAALGLPWHFLPYDNATMRRRYRDPDYRAFMAYSDSLTGIHFPQDFVAVSALLDSGILPRDALVVNGQSGDFITGNHIPAALQGAASDGADGPARVIDALLAKHFTQWGFLSTPANIATLSDLLSSELAQLTDGDPKAADDRLFGLYEASEYVDRQSKYVVNGQRAYEFLGLDWDLPLWHPALIDFYETQPLATKAGQRLYRDTLVALNWGGVWNRVPINELTIRPTWLRPVRLALKLAHAPFGKSRWHRFERRYLNYFMTTLCAYAVRSWGEVAMDRRAPRTAIAFHIEDYLSAHGIDMNSLGDTA